MAKIYNDFQPANLMSFAKSFARLNGQPLDKSEIWYNLADAQAYAATDAAYIGQILAVIDSEKNNVVFYGIQDAAGSLKEVGSSPVGDNLSIEIVDGKVQVKGFGKEYYAYIPAEKDEEGNIVKASEYVLTEGFKAGLEPRVVAKGEDLVIAWYEPGTETVEDIAANVESVSKTVESLDEVLNAEGGLVDQVDELKDQVGQAADEAGNEATGLYKALEDLEKVVDTKADANKVFTKEETNSAIAAAIANVDHLKREIVDVLPEIEDADTNTIYMVSRGLTDDDNKYYEYIVINGIFEPVGSWEIDLSQYAKKEEVNNSLATKVDVVEGSRLMTEAEGEKLAALKIDAEKNFINSVADEFKVEEGKLELVSVGQDKITGLNETLSNIGNEITNINNELDNKVDAVEGSRLITNDEAKKLSALVVEEDGSVAISGTVGAGKVQELYDNVVRIVTGTGTAEYDGEQKNLLGIAPGAEVNVVNTVNLTDFTLDETRTLNLNDIPISKVTNLSNMLDSKVSIASLDDNHFTVSNGIISLKESYVTNGIYKAEVGDLTKLLHSALAEDGSVNENSTLVDEINYINERLTWIDMNV